jgi:hypothetical protein
MSAMIPAQPLTLKLGRGTHFIGCHAVLCPYVVAVYCDHTTIRQTCFVCQQSIVKKELVVNVLL